MLQNYVDDNIKVLRPLDTYPSDASDQLAYVYLTSTPTNELSVIRSGLSAYAGQAFIADITTDTLLSVELEISGTVADFEFVIVTYASTYNLDTLNLSTGVLASNLFHSVKLADNMSASGKFLVPKLSLDSGQKQYVAIASTTNTVGALDTLRLNARLHTEDYKFFNPAK